MMIETHINLNTQKEKNRLHTSTYCLTCIPENRTRVEQNLREIYELFKITVSTATHMCKYFVVNNGFGFYIKFFMDDNKGATRKTLVHMFQRNESEVIGHMCDDIPSLKQ